MQNLHLLLRKTKNKLEKKEKELIKICNKYRKSNGEYDVIVPGSGGKIPFMLLMNWRINIKWIHY